PEEQLLRSGRGGPAHDGLRVAAEVGGRRDLLDVGVGDRAGPRPALDRHADLLLHLLDRHALAALRRLPAVATRAARAEHEHPAHRRRVAESSHHVLHLPGRHRRPPMCTYETRTERAAYKDAGPPRASCLTARARIGLRRTLRAVDLHAVHGTANE